MVARPAESGSGSKNHAENTCTNHSIFTIAMVQVYEDKKLDQPGALVRILSHGVFGRLSIFNTCELARNTRNTRHKHKPSD